MLVDPRVRARTSLIVSFVLIAVACSNEKPRRHSGGNGAETAPVTTTAAPVTETSAFSNPSTLNTSIGFLFDPNYDWNPTDSFSASQLTQRFPIRLSTDQLPSQIAFLQSPTEFFAAKMTLLSSAKVSVRLQTLIFRADEAGYLVAAKLAELVKRGVRVSVIIDPVVNYSLDDQKLFFAMRKVGISVEGYEIGYLNYLKGITGSAGLNETFADANMRYHEKILVIDAETPHTALAITGGTNFSTEYHNVNQSTPVRFWYDRDVALRGPIAQDLAVKFDTTYGEFVARKQSTQPTALDGILQIVQLFSQGGDLRLPDSLDANKLNSLRSQSQVALAFAWESSDLRYIESRPRFKEDLIYPALIAAIAQAKSEILIHHSYLLPEPQLSQALRAAVQRGVKVRIITNHEGITDFPQLNVLARSYYKDLLAANGTTGVGEMLKLYEWAGDRVLHNGVGLNHSKYVVIDRQSVLVGSFNLDPRSRYLNSEGKLIVRGNIAKTFAAEFDEHTLPKWTVPIDMAAALKFSAPTDLKSQFDLILSRLMTPIL